MDPARAGHEMAGRLDAWASRIDERIHQQGGQIRYATLGGGNQLPIALRGRISFAEALEHCGFPITSGPGGGMVKSRSLAARADRALTTPSSGPKHQHQRQWRAATPARTNATLSSLCSAVNKRPKTAGAAHFRAPYLDTKEAERRQQRASRFGNVPSAHRSVRTITYRPSPDPNPDSNPSPHPGRLTLAMTRTLTRAGPDASSSTQCPRHTAHNVFRRSPSRKAGQRSRTSLSPSRPAGRRSCGHSLA